MRVTAILILATFFICAAQTKSGNKKQGIIRKKFFFSIGVGPALVSNYTRIYDPTGSIDKNFNQGAISTDFRLGYALSPYWIIYYDNKACFLNAYTLANTTTGRRKLLFSE